MTLWLLKVTTLSRKDTYYIIYVLISQSSSRTLTSVAIVIWVEHAQILLDMTEAARASMIQHGLCT